MIIDGRLRPATDPYLRSTVYVHPSTEVYHKRFGVPMAPSVKEKSMELCLQEMDEMKIDLGLAPARWGSGPTPIVPPEEVVRVMQEYPKRFYGAIPICPAKPQLSLEYIEKFVINGPVKAVCMEPGVSPIPMYFNDARIYPIYDLLQSQNIPLFLMAGGLCGPDISYANPEKLDKVLVDFPRLKVINIHGGVPYVDQVIFSALRRPNLYLCPDMYLTNTPYWQPFIEAANCMLQDQILFGTSYPFVPMKEGYEIFMKLNVKDEVMEKIMYKNAARALDIDPEDYRRF